MAFLLGLFFCLLLPLLEASDAIGFVPSLRPIGVLALLLPLLIRRLDDDDVGRKVLLLDNCAVEEN